MKPIMILTSLLTLSACGGGFFWFDSILEPTEPATPGTTETANVINPANENITKITSFVDGSTDLTDVEFERNVDSKRSYTFILDADGRINQIQENDDGVPGETFTRQGDTNEFIGDINPYHYTFTSYGDGKLAYSDFGIWDNLGYIHDEMLIAGGYNSKEIEATLAVVENQLCNGTDPVFKGNAVASVRKYAINAAGNDGHITAVTNNAELRFNSSGYELSMPFHTKSSGGPDYYDVVVVGNNITNNTVQVNFQGGYNGEYKFANDNGSGASFYSSLRSKMYGDDGNVSEMVGYVGPIDDKSEAYSAGASDHKVFEAGFGVKKQ